MTSLIIELAVGTTDGGSIPGDLSVVSLDDARHVAAAAEQAGATALRLVDQVAGDTAGVLDPSVVAGFLAGATTRLGYVIDLTTSHQAPYNVARRLLSLDRATAGRVGLALRPGLGDEVSEAVAPDPVASDPLERWEEHARILTALWESFPREALVGDQEAAVVADVSRIRPIAHVGRFYRVAGPLDGPTSEQVRPVLVADLREVDPSAAGGVADVVVLDGPDAVVPVRTGAASVLSRQVVTAEDLADVPALAASLLAAVQGSGLDGLVLAPRGGPEVVLEVVRRLVPLLEPAVGPTLRSALGLGAPVPVG